MKKLFFAFISAALVICSCAKINDVSVEDYSQSQSKESVFKTGSHFGVSTRAIVGGTSMEDHFGAYGYVLPGDHTDGGYILKNAEYDEAGDAANGAHYYWPKSDNNTNIGIIFTAYSQYDSNVAYDDATGNITITVPTLTQALINDPSDFDDILWAQTDTVNHQNSLADHARVPLNFRHALSWLQFNAEVATNPSIKAVKIQSVKFGQFSEGQEYQPAVPGTPYQPAVPAVMDTTDTWFNLRRSSNVDGSPTKTSTDGGSTYVDNYEIPSALVAEIKSYYSINNGTAGDYDLHMGNSVWPSAEIRQLRIVKDVPAAYRMPVEAANGDIVVFFDALKYLNDNGYKVAARTSGGKPAVFDYPIIDLFVNGTAYTIVGLNFAVGTVYDANVAGNIPALEYVIEEVSPAIPEVPEVPGTPEVPAIPAGISPDSLYVNGTISLPTRSIATGFTLTSGDKAESFEFAPQVDTLFGTSYSGIHETVLSNALVISQPVPEYITLIFDICLLNSTGDEVWFKNRVITRKINAGKDADNHDYVTSWQSAYKYIYNFKVNVENVDFSVLVNGWDANDNSFHIWEY